jgi:hypothetical protein
VSGSGSACCANAVVAAATINASDVQHPKGD